jgi:uncharacterized membrane protein
MSPKDSSARAPADRRMRSSDSAPADACFWVSKCRARRPAWEPPTRFPPTRLLARWPQLIPSPSYGRSSAGPRALGSPIKQSESARAEYQIEQASPALPGRADPQPVKHPADRRRPDGRQRCWTRAHFRRSPPTRLAPLVALSNDCRVSTALIIVGLVFLVVGLVVFVWPSSSTQPQGVLTDIQEVLKQVNALLDKFDKRYRPGLILMLVGLTLVALGVYKEALDAKNAAKTAGPSPTALILRGRSSAH